MLCRCKVIHLKYGSFVWPCRSVRGTTYFLPIYFSAWNRWCTYHGWHTLELLTSLLSNVHFKRWIWFSAQGWLYEQWDTLFFFWFGFCMAGSWARRLSLCVALKSFPRIFVCTQTGRRRLCLCSLTEQTATARSAAWILMRYPSLFRDMLC